MKKLGAPDENRRKAKKLFDEEEKAQNKEITDYGCDETECDDGIADVETEIKRKNKKSAKEYAMALLSIKTYTESALRQKLKIRGYGLDETEQAIEYARRFGYVNDLRLAQNAAEKLAKKPWGKKRIFSYLRQKGIPSSIIEQVDLGEIDFKENALTLARKYAASGKTKEQAARALFSAGFSSAEISNAIEVLCSDFFQESEYPFSGE